MTLIETIEQWKAEAEAAIEAERDEVQYLTLCLIVNHRIPRLCKVINRQTKSLENIMGWMSQAGQDGWRAMIEAELEVDTRILEESQ